MTDETAAPTVPNAPENPTSIYDFVVLDAIHTSVPNLVNNQLTRHQSGSYSL